MKKTLIGLAALFASAAGAHAQVSIPYTEIAYNVHYHWGLINVMIAHGRATVATEGNSFVATMDGNSIPWDGRVFCVSDTLHAVMTPRPGALSHEQVTYENGWYMKPKVSQFRSGNFVPTDPANYKNIRGEGTLDASGQTMEAITVTSDMLGLFYYFHEIDFAAMQPGQSITIPISGGYAREVVVTYNGQSQQTASGVTYPTYSVTFEYSYGGAMSGYPVHAEVSTTSRIPVLISASLPVGKVELIYDPD